MTRTDFITVFEESKPRFEAIARSYVFDRVVAEDIVMESFCSYLQRQNEGRLPEEVNVPAYILTIVKNQCLNYLERKRRGMEIARALYMDQIREVDLEIGSLRNLDIDRLFADEVVEKVKSTLENMPHLTRAIFEKLRFEEKSYKEIAEELNISQVKIDNENRKAIRILRKALSGYILEFGGLVDICLLAYYFDQISK